MHATVRTRAAGRRPALLALAGALTLVLAACSGPDGQSTTDPTGGAEEGGETPQVTVGLTYTPDVQFAPFYLAESSGAFERAGVDVTLRHHGANEPLFGALEAGEEDVVFAGGDEMMQARSQGIDVVTFATMYQTYPVVLIVPADSPIEEPADLAGHSVGLPGPYGENWFGLLALLDRAGLTEDDVRIENIGYTQQSALTTGAVDAVVGFSNNDAVQIEAAGTAIRAIPVVPEGEDPLVGSALGASSTLIEEDSEALARVLTALREAMDAQAQDAESVVKVSREYVPGLADAGAAQNAQRTWEATLSLYGDVPLGTQDMDRFARMSEFLAAAGITEGTVAPEEAATTAIVDRVE